jgi:hypothetical protein
MFLVISSVSSFEFVLVGSLLTFQNITKYHQVPLIQKQPRKLLIK